MIKSESRAIVVDCYVLLIMISKKNYFLHKNILLRATVNINHKTVLKINRKSFKF